MGLSNHDRFPLETMSYVITASNPVEMRSHHPHIRVCGLSNLQLRNG